ncbi:MAG TPA: VIT family protein [Candidatus Paceibacterota bacterium]|nr:VIT family protein [Candidatus Paceibacterota bacterium]
MTDESHNEPHGDAVAPQLNWLRAAILGANDGIVSVSALVMGVAGASAGAGTLLLTGVAGMLAGAMSMAVGEYVSVSSQRDTEKALLEKERMELEQFPEQELEELTQIYQKKGMKRATAELVAREMTEHDAFGTHVREELNIHPEELTNPWHAAIASALSFFAGAVIPLAAIVLPTADIRVPVAATAVTLALIATGIFSAKMSGARVLPVTMRVVIGGILAMAITFYIGRFFGVNAL